MTVIGYEIVKDILEGKFKCGFRYIFYDKVICSIILIYGDALDIASARALQSLCQISLILANQITLITYLPSKIL
jgi:hypothetical protein